MSLTEPAKCSHDDKDNNVYRQVLLPLTLAEQVSWMGEDV
jgi:hypothetical protein